MNPLVQSITLFLSVLTVAGDAVVLLILASLVFKEIRKKHPIFHAAHNFVKKNAVIFAFIIALFGTVSSLFYSVVAGFPPCSLCIWQRILLYPQVILLGVTLWLKNKKLHFYSILLSAGGVILALYNSFIQFGGSPIIPCASSGISVSCAKRYFLEFGYVTIPTMALTSFLLIVLLLIAIQVEKEPEVKLF